MKNSARSSRPAAGRLLHAGARRYAGLLLLMLMLAAAADGSAWAAAPSSAAEAASPPSPPTLRLGDAAKPTRCALDLTVVPSSSTFTGTADIDVQLRQPTTLLWLNATDLDIAEAHAQAGDQSL